MSILAQAGWLNSIGLTGLYIGVGVVLLVISARILDLLTPGKLFEEIILKGNSALGIVTVSSWIADALIIAGVIGSSSQAGHEYMTTMFSNPEVSAVASVVIWSVVGIFFKFVIYGIFGSSERFKEALLKGNVAAGVYLAGVLLAPALIICAVVKG